ncbi:DUF4007 family protein [uncultured Mitsuokella sp.]|jgi:hypothetical protein|uniref:DUF4007 family protein n=1 Tax=Mitsuokella sp. TaxID=2049034 RepID=UPI00266F81F6|nr:DUF4007 family protein [uncultured Mitsuokella sp.]
MKFRGHETFFIRKGWLTKGMKYVKRHPDVFVSKEEKPMDVLGIGNNMVKSLRYWMQAVGITKEPTHGKRVQQFTLLGELIYRYDRYLEEQGTLCLLQYKLASNKDEATAWYFFFNEFQMLEFTKDDFIKGLKNYVMMQDGDTSVADRSYQDDFSCIINTYISRSKSNRQQVSPENNIACPLGELGLLDYASQDKIIYRKTMVQPQMISPYIALAIILLQNGDAQEVSLDTLLHAPKSIGRAFNLDMTVLMHLLKQLEQLGEVEIVRTAGLDVVHIMTEYTAQECIEHYYQDILKE